MADPTTATRRAIRLIPDKGSHRLETVREPAPQPGAGQVLVRMEAVSLNYRDLLVLRGELGPVREGLIPLSDGAGQVMAVGAGVTRWQEGDRVAPIFYPGWINGSYHDAYGPAALSGGEADGVLADLIVVAEASLVRVPQALSLEEGATLPCAALTAWQALVVRGRLGPGDTLLVQGTGGVALFGLQIANALGAKTVVLSSSDEKRERVEKLGAFATVNYHTTPEWDIEVRELTDGIGVSHILELGGPDTFDRSLRTLAGGGRIAQIGVFTGFGPRSNLIRLQQINGTIDGINVGSAEQFNAMNTFFAEHRIKPIIDRIFTFDEAQAAYEELGSGRHFGKLVIRL